MSTAVVVVQLKMVELIVPQSKVKETMNNYCSQVYEFLDKEHGKAFESISVGLDPIRQGVLFTVRGVDKQIATEMMGIIIQAWVKVTDGKGSGPDGVQPQSQHITKKKPWWKFW